MEYIEKIGKKTQFPPDPNIDQILPPSKLARSPRRSLKIIFVPYIHTIALTLWIDKFITFKKDHHHGGADCREPAA
jgi:hypothetical protein